MADLDYKPAASEREAAPPQKSAADVYNELTALSKKTEQSKSNREKSMIRVFVATLTALGIAVIILGAGIIICAVGWSRAQGVVVPQIVEVEKEKIVEVPEFMIIDPSVEYERKLSDEMMLLNDGAYGPIWVPILEDVPKSTYDQEDFVKNENTGYMDYLGREEYMKGVDVSVYQGEIDWQKVKDAGFDFAILRAGNRGYVTGMMVEDSTFRQNIEGALDAGLQVGVYFFSQALTPEEALEEAEFVINLLDGYDITFPVAYDWEVVVDSDGDTARTAYIEPTDLTNNFLVFAQRLEMEGYTPIVYTNKKTAVWKYDLSRMTDYDIWLAEYNDTPSLPYKWEMWQYTGEGRVPGIDGDVDLNICFKDYSQVQPEAVPVEAEQ